VGITSIQSPKATSSTNTRGAGCSATARTLIQLARRSTHPMACAERRSEANTLVERGHTDSQFVTSATTNAAAGQFAKLLSSPTRLRLSYGSFASSQGAVNKLRSRAVSIRTAFVLVRLVAGSHLAASPRSKLHLRGPVARSLVPGRQAAADRRSVALGRCGGTP
jgi:hypothetical protein